MPSVLRGVKRTCSALALGVGLWGAFGHSAAAPGTPPGLSGQALSAKVDPALNATFAQMAAGDEVEALIAVKGQADPAVLQRAEALAPLDYLEKRKLWVAHLQETTGRAQAGLLQQLKSQGIRHRSYWINNTLYVSATAPQLQALAAREDVRFVHANPKLAARKPVREAMTPMATAAIEWNISKIRAPQVWASGVKGKGVTIAGEDTGYQWDHPAIKRQYRGWNGASVNHNYNWYDATHSGSSSCGPNQTTPCDDNGHGTHTIGTMVGDDGGGNQVGVAPEAQWIGCRNMIGGVGTPARYTECLQWLVAPTDVNGKNPDPSKAPDVSSHSWGCTASEGCSAQVNLQTAVENVVRAGIMVVAAAGNEGPNCGTIKDPPGTLDAAFTVASTTSSDAMSSFSSRGPVQTAKGMKPDLSAPGSNVRSAWIGGGYNSISGTSMATPHVAGVAALLISANPALRGKPDQIAALLKSTTFTGLTNSQTCGGVAPTVYPNPVAGTGRIDAYAAYQKAIGGSTNKPPVASFKAVVSGLSVNFTDSSTDPDGSIASRLWNFGNGQSSTAANPSHTYATAGSYSVTLQVTDNQGASASSAQTVVVGNVLQNGVPRTGLSAARNASLVFSIQVPAGKSSLKFVTSGGTGDADVYAKLGATPTTSSFDCKSTGPTNAETCTINSPQAGTYYVMVRAYSAFSGLSLTASHP
jgi:serine protease AprX